MIALTGIKPTGKLHLGNYLGALRSANSLAKDHELFCFVADLHALNAGTDPKALRQNSLDIARHLMALLPESVHIYRQSQISEISEISMLLAQVCPSGLLKRSHAYKVAREGNLEREEPEEAGINMGLVLYPLLMAADILGMGAEVVPVGPDQVSHHELARDLGNSFHARYGSVFRDPKAFLEQPQSLPGLDGRKMSKSYDNVIALFGPERKKAVRRITTDSRSVGVPLLDYETDTIYQLYSFFARDRSELIEHYKSGGGYGQAKDTLNAALDLYFAAPEALYESLTDAQVKERLEMGEIVARKRARSYLSKMQKRMGLR